MFWSFKICFFYLFTLWNIFISYNSYSFQISISYLIVCQNVFCSVLNQKYCFWWQYPLFYTHTKYMMKRNITWTVFWHSVLTFRFTMFDKTLLPTFNNIHKLNFSFPNFYLEIRTFPRTKNPTIGWNDLIILSPKSDKPSEAIFLSVTLWNLTII